MLTALEVKPAPDERWADLEALFERPGRRLGGAGRLLRRNVSHG
jgi:hypothetical protein